MIALASAVLSGVLYGLSFPPFHLHALAWIAFVPLFLTLDSSRGRFFSTGFIAGLVANLIIFIWLWKTFAAAQIVWPTTLMVWILLSAVMALYFGCVSFVAGRLPENWAWPWLIASAWIGLEAVRSHVMTGFPWALFGHTQAYDRSLLQLASLTGEPGISFLLVASNVAMAGFLKKRNRSALINLMLAVILVAGARVWGEARITRVSAFLESSPKFNVAVLQGNIDQYQKWDESYELGIRTRYEQLVIEASKTKPSLIIWPESAVPGWFPNQLPYVEWINSVVRKSGITHLIGAVTSRNKKDFNAAFLIDPIGHVTGEYDKQHLVPFGEYIPFGGFMKRWIPYLGQLGTFEAGEKPVLFPVAGVNVAPNICYEAVFPGLIQHAVSHGADVIVNITNDGWFLDTGAPEQHYVSNIFRAVETGRPVVRAANTGISAVIDATGREIVRSQLLTAGVYAAAVPIGHVDTFVALLYSKLCHEN